mgnify:CR=1 FL=1
MPGLEAKKYRCPIGMKVRTKGLRIEKDGLHKAAPLWQDISRLIGKIGMGIENKTIDFDPEETTPKQVKKNKGPVFRNEKTDYLFSAYCCCSRRPIPYRSGILFRQNAADEKR